MSETKLKLCPSCLLEVVAGDEVEICPDCKAVYHKTCWVGSNPCKDELCPGNIKKREAAAALKVFCGKCGAALKPTQEFCPKCGTPRPVKKSSVAIEKVAEPAKANEAPNDVSKENITQNISASADVPAVDVPTVSDSQPKTSTAAKRFCGGCGFELKPGQKFCGRCGRPTTN